MFFVFTTMTLFITVFGSASKQPTNCPNNHLHLLCQNVDQAPTDIHWHPMFVKLKLHSDNGPAANRTQKRQTYDDDWVTYLPAAKQCDTESKWGNSFSNRSQVMACVRASPDPTAGVVRLVSLRDAQVSNLASFKNTHCESVNQNQTEVLANATLKNAWWSPLHYLTFFQMCKRICEMEAPNRSKHSVCCP